MKSITQLRQELEILGFTYSSTHAGGGFRETWWKHPSGAAVNLDEDPETPEANTRRVNRAPSCILIYDFKNKVQARADEIARDRGPEIKADIHYYVGRNRYGSPDWLVSFQLHGTTIQYSCGQDILPEEHALVASHFA